MVSKNYSKTRNISEKVAIVTTTLYNPDLESDILRSELAKSTVRQATNLGYEMIIVDSGSSDELLKDLERYGAKIFCQQEKNMGSCRRQAIKEAVNTKKEVIAWTEPEKENYIPEIVKTAKPIIEDYADLVVPRRKSLKSYPTAQQYAEPLGNSFWKNLTSYDLDMWFGPRTWKKELSHYFMDYNGEYGDKWDSIFIPVMDAIFDEKKIISIEVKYTHPKKQTEIEEHDLNFYTKRIEQLSNLSKTLETHWKRIHK